MKPGNIVLPSKSTSSVSSFFNFSISSFNPIFTIFPFSTKTASTVGSLSLTVIMFPLKYIFLILFTPNIYYLKININQISYFRSSIKF